MTLSFHKFFFLQIGYELPSRSRKLYERGFLIRAGALENVLKKINGETLIRDSRVV